MVLSEAGSEAVGASGNGSAGQGGGELPAVVLLHSGVADSRMWEPQVRALEKRFRVLAPDLRGFGDRPHEPGPFSHADDVLALLDAEGVERAALVGSSFGGRVALDVATTAPDRVSALVLLCAAAPGLPRTDDVRAFGQEEDRLLEAGDLDAAAEALAPQPEPIPVDIDPAALGMPALVVGGGHDLEWFQQTARHLAGSMSRAELVILDWAGHLPSLERPDEVSGLLREFLEQELRPAR